MPRAETTSLAIPFTDSTGEKISEDDLLADTPSDKPSDRDQGAMSVIEHVEEKKRALHSGPGVGGGGREEEEEEKPVRSMEEGLKMIVGHIRNSRVEEENPLRSKL
ncbi:hypothetical protein RUND412_003987 [Rhizina undulata]